MIESQMNDSNKVSKVDHDTITEINGNSPISKWVKILNDIKKKYKIGLIFDLLNLGNSVACCSAYIYSTYDPSAFSNSQSYIWYNFLTRIYFLCDFIFNLLTMKGEKKFEYYTYVLVEMITIVPFLFIRLIAGINEDFIDVSYLLTNALVCIRIIRIQYLSKYIVSFLFPNI
jgi:hypothetical protein